MEMRNELMNRKKRGKVEVNLTVEYKEGKQATQINASIVKDYYNQLKAIASELGVTAQEPLLQSVMRMPEALNNDKHNIDPEESAKIMQTLNLAMAELDKFRSTEGKALANDIAHRVELIESFLNQIDPFEKERSEMIRGKLESSLLEFVPNESIDKNRYEQELI